MASISEIWRKRLILIGLLLLSLLPTVLHQMLLASELYSVRLLGGMRPLDLSYLQTISQSSFACPAIITAALITSAIRPTPALTRWLIAISAAILLLYLTAFLVLTVLTIELRVPV